MRSSRLIAHSTRSRLIECSCLAFSGRRDVDVKGAPLPGDCLFEPSEHALHACEASIRAPPTRRDQLAEKLDVLQALVSLSLDLEPHVLQPRVDHLVEPVAVSYTHLTLPTSDLV